jgi:hypothetical protein
MPISLPRPNIILIPCTFQLDSLKSDLRDVLYSHKWTPDAYLLAKAYIAEDDAKEQEKTLPKLSLKNPSRKL